MRSMGEVNGESSAKRAILAARLATPPQGMCGWAPFQIFMRVAMGATAVQHCVLVTRYRAFRWHPRRIAAPAAPIVRGCEKPEPEVKRRELLTLIAAAGTGPVCMHSQAADVVVTGAGASFPAKVYQQWADQYTRETGVKVNYAPTGSSAGVKQIIAREVDFAATDVPMSNADLERHGLFQFPTLVGGVVPVVNLPGVASGALHLNGEVLAGIFAGQIANWKDRSIAALNPGLALPDLRIARVVRADGSGTTEVFVTYLKQAAPAAAAPIESQGSRAKWPGAVTGADGTGKLVDAVKATPGAIGYVSSDHVARDGLSPVSLRNKHGDWVAPTLDTYRAAMRAGGLFKTSLEPVPLIDLDGFSVWPIVTATYIVVPRAPASLERAGRALNFFYRSFLLGDRAVAGTGFTPLPTATQARIVTLLSAFRTPDGKLVPVLGEIATQQPRA
jgi:phosphate transport system substrate-binding protein